MVQSVASHAPPTQLSPGGDRADIWGEEGEERPRGEKEKRRQLLLGISSQALSFEEDAGSGKGFSR